MRSIQKYITWINLKKINSSKFINSMYIWIIIVPILAKIFSNLDKEVFNFLIFGEILPLQLKLPFSWALFYFSAIFFAIANLIFTIRCPLIIKENNSYNDFLTEGKKLLQLKPYIEDVNYDWNKLANDIDKKIDSQNNSSYMSASSISLNMSIEKLDKVNEEKNNPKNYFWEIYNFTNFVREKSRVTIGILYFIGFCLFSIVLIQNFITIFTYM